MDVRIDRQVIPKALRSEIEAFDVGVDTKLIVELGSNNGLYQVQNTNTRWPKLSNGLKAKRNY